jgi:hypothetical protein
MTKLIYPTLDLFLYDLREGLGQSDAEMQQNRHRFLQKLPATIDEAAFIQQDEKYFEPEYVELLENRTEPLQLPQNWLGDGYYYPTRLNDTYGLLLDCSLKNAQISEDLAWLQALQTFINDKVKGQTGTIGQSWLFSAQLPYLSLEEHEEIAKRCYEALMPGGRYEDHKIGSCEFLGGSLFECGPYHSAKQTGHSDNHHVMMAFYPDESTAKKAAELFYTDWMRLFCYRHKMLWAYGQSRVLKKRLKQASVKIEECRQAIYRYSTPKINHQQLPKTLDEAWKILAEYTPALNSLEQQARTIDINLYNYQQRWRTLQEKAAQPLVFLDKLSQTVQHKYLKQLEKDYKNFTIELSLENIVGYIRDRLAIEEDRRERAFQKSIATWGIGLATGAIVASMSGQFPEMEWLKSYLSQGWVKPATSLIWSFGAAVMAGLITKGVIGLRHR